MFKQAYIGNSEYYSQNLWKTQKFIFKMHFRKSVRIRSFSDPHFPAFGLNTEIYGVNLPIQFECGKIWTRKTSNTDTFYAVMVVGEFGKCKKTAVLKIS